MFEREPGYYWIAWSERADTELAARKPGPLVAQWDGKVWWLVRSDVYRFDCEVEVLDSALAPPRQSFLRPMPAALAAAG
jgi:hypothetical protein